MASECTSLYPRLVVSSEEEDAFSMTDIRAPDVLRILIVLGLSI